MIKTDKHKYLQNPFLFMRGISPVIATVLLLLMAVAAVGGAWVWYQRQSALIGGKTEEKIAEQVEQQAGIAISLADIYKDSGDYLHLIISNAGSTSVNLTNVMISGPKGSDYISLSCTIPGKGTADCNTTKKYTTYCDSSEEKVTIKLFASGISTQEFTENCPA